LIQEEIKKRSILVMLATIGPEPSVFLSAVEKQKLEYTRLQFCMWICMSLKLGPLTLREEHRLRVFENGAEEDIWTEE
jgi:hypothetical protein